MPTMLPAAAAQRRVLTFFAVCSLISVPLLTLAQDASQDSAPCPAPTATADTSVSATTTTSTADTATPTTESSTDAAPTTSSTTDTTATGSTTEPASTAPSAPTALPTVVVSELLVNPVGIDTDSEFIELWNLDATTADLSGWSLVNAAAKSYVLTGVSIPAHGFLALPYAQTKIALTNTGGTITLKDPSGAVRSVVTYGGDGKEGQSYARTSIGSYEWTPTPTPGAVNQFPAPTASATTDTTTTTTTSTTDPTTTVTDTTATTGMPVVTDALQPTEETFVEVADATEPCDCLSMAAMADGTDEEPADTVTMAELHELGDGTVVTVHAIVSLPPGRVGKTIFAVQSADGNAGTYVRMYGTERPPLAAGDEVVITGKIAHANGSVRVTTGKGGVMPTGRAPGIEAAAVALADLENVMDGVTVTVEGALVESGKGWVRLGDESGQHELRVNFGDGHAFKNIPAESVITISGVLQFKNGTPELLADSANLHFTAPVAQTTDAASTTSSQIAGAKTGASSPLVGGALALSPILASLGVLGWKKVKSLPIALS